jgi:glycosyltransferase involved in cell wall biosynthesis
MRLSVVTPTHGRRPLVERTLRSLEAQRGAGEFEVVVVDDGADPGLGDHLTGLGLGVELRVVHLPENRGRSAARNAGIAATRGEVVVFLDSDMEVVAGFLAAHRAAHDGPDTVVLGNILTAPEVGGGAFVDYIDSRGVKKVAPGDPIPPRYFMTGNSSVSRAMLARAGGFDEDFDEYGGEDTEFGYRLGAHGGHFRYAPDAVSYHLDLNSVPAMARRLRRYGERMLPILVRKVPAARRELGLHLAEPPDLGGDGIGLAAKKLACFLLCRRSFWAPAARLGEALPRGVPAETLFDFVRAAAYLDGYRAAVRRPR